MTIKAILLDIEGTTAPISFVADVLFPFAAERLADFVHAHAEDARFVGALRETAELEARALSTDEAVATLLGWIKADRKATPLKTLQGMIWREGYESGRIISPVYRDAVDQMRLWKTHGYRLDVVFVRLGRSTEATLRPFGCRRSDAASSAATSTRGRDQSSKQPPIRRSPASSVSRHPKSCSSRTLTER